MACIKKRDEQMHALHAQPEHSMALQRLRNQGHNLDSTCIPYKYQKKVIGYLRRYIQFCPAESELDLDLGYIQNVLTDYDSKYLQTSVSD